MSVKVKDTFTPRLTRGLLNFPAAMRYVMKTGGDDLVDSIKRKTPVYKPDLFSARWQKPPVPGEVRESIHVDRVQGIAGIYRVTVKSDHPIASILEYGSRPHIIRHGVNPVLVYYKNGRLHYSRNVAHPGTKAYHMFRDGAREFNLTVERRFDRAIRGWIQVNNLS